MLEWIEVNPAFGMLKRRRKTVKNRARGQRPLEEHEIADVRQANPIGTRRRAVFESLLATGFRRGDSQKVPIGVADQPVIALFTNKTGQLVVGPVTKQMRDAAQAWVNTRAATTLPPSKFLLASETGQAITDRTVSSDIADLFAAAKMPGRTVHCLRYTAAVRLLEAGFAYDDVAEHLGHDRARMARQYCSKRRAAQVRGRVLDSIDAETVDARI
jgi:site-specific recombinase XerD